MREAIASALIHRRQVSGQVEPLRLLDKGKEQMLERSYLDALDTFSTLALHDDTLVPIVWKGTALKRLGRLSEAIGVLSDGLKNRGAKDEKFRRAVALRNLACHRTLLNKSSADKNFVDSVIELLNDALQNAPEFRQDLAVDDLDPDLSALRENPVFMSDKETW